MRFKVICSYDGTDFLGWQSQVGGGSVQDALEAHLARIFKRPIRIHGSSRTDRGVHARAQVFHFDADWNHSFEALGRALRDRLPKGMGIVSVKPVDERWHARYDAIGKRYVYECICGQADPFQARYTVSLGTRRYDLAKMNAAAQLLLGTHDFSAYGCAHGDAQKEDLIKTLHRLEWVQIGPRLRMITEGSGYLYKMVRSLAGVLFSVGTGWIEPEMPRFYLERKLRTREIPTAPAHGLFLEKVYYPEDASPRFAESPASFKEAQAADR